MNACAALALALALALVMALVQVPAAALQPVPAPTAHVVDQTATLTPAEAGELDQRLAAFEARKGSQLAVMTVASTAPEALEQYAMRVAEQWKLARRKVNDGALLLVAMQDRAVRIEVGYGLEGVLNDATCKRIVEETITPRLRAGDYAGGIGQGIAAVMRVVDGEPLPPPAEAPAEDGLGLFLPLAVMGGWICGFVMRALLGRFGGSLATGGLVALLIWWLAGTLAAGLMAGLIAAAVSAFGGLGFLPFGGLGSRNGRRGLGGLGGGFGGGGASGRW